MKKIFQVFLTCLFLSLQAYTQNAADLDSIKSYTQKLLDGVAKGESGAWEKYLDDSCVITSEDGSVKSKQEFTKRILPPRSYLKVRETISDPVFRANSNTIVFCYTANLFVDLFGQERIIQICQTDTWIKNMKSWRLIATMAMDRSQPPIPQKISILTIKAIVGEYRLSKEYGYKIFENGGKLFGQRFGMKEQELKCESGYVFFTDSNPRNRIIFALDSNGIVTQLISRRAGTDITFPKVD